jgi:NADPH2:quinone reductase
MLSVIHKRFGDPARVLETHDSAFLQPGPGQVRIRMTLASIHNHDLLTVAGLYGYKPDLPSVAGTEATGTIDALGEGVSGFSPGQRIAVSGVRGAWAEYFLAPAASLVPLPDAISDETAAQLISMPLSALVLLEYLGVSEGQWVIQNAATGAVAKVLAMIAAHKGVNVVNVVRRPAAIAELQTLGIDHVVSSADSGWQDTVRSMTGSSPIVAAVDGVGGTSAGDLMSLVGENGTLVSFGGMSGEPLQIASRDLVFKQAAVKGFWLAKIMQTAKREDIGRWMSELVRLVATGVVKLQTSGIYPLDEIAAAARASAEAGRTGKILLRP